MYKNTYVRFSMNIFTKNASLRRCYDTRCLIVNMVSIIKMKNAYECINRKLTLEALAYEHF